MHLWATVSTSFIFFSIDNVAIVCLEPIIMNCDLRRLMLIYWRWGKWLLFVNWSPFVWTDIPQSEYVKVLCQHMACPFCRSLIYRKNSIGPKIVPYWISWVIGRASERTPLTVHMLWHVKLGHEIMTWKGQRVLSERAYYLTTSVALQPCLPRKFNWTNTRKIYLQQVVHYIFEDTLCAIF